MRDLDRVQPVTEERVKRANELFDELYLLAEKVQLVDEDGWVDAATYQQIEKLENGFRALGQVPIVFSGEGFAPYVMPDGEEDTLYMRMELQHGVFSALELADEEAVAYTPRDEIEATDETDEGDTLMQQNYVINEARNKALHPPEGMRLYAEFLMMDTDSEVPVAGSSVRAKGLAYYALMNAGALQFDGFGEIQKPISTEETILDDLHQASRRIHHLFKSTEFRRRSVVEQRTIVDRALMEIDKQIQIERFRLMVDPKDMLVPDTSHENRRLRQVTVDRFEYSISATPIKIDTINTFNLHNGQAIRSNRQLDGKSNCGIYIVADIGEAMQQVYGMPTSIVWVPVPFPSRRRQHPITGFDAHLELME